MWLCMCVYVSACDCSLTRKLRALFHWQKSKQRKGMVLGWKAARGSNAASPTSSRKHQHLPKNLSIMPWKPATGVQSTLRLVFVFRYVQAEQDCSWTIIRYAFVVKLRQSLHIWELTQNNSKYPQPDLWWDWDKKWNCTACNCRINTEF